MAKENDRLIAADSLRHGSMTLQARDGPVTLLPSSGAQMGFTLAPRDFNYNPKVDLRTVDPSRRVVDLTSATFMDDISRIQIFAAPPSVAEVVLKMNRAHSMLEESLGEGDWTLNASKTANVIMMREEGVSATTKGLIDKRRELRGVACSEARLLGPHLKAEGKNDRNWKESNSGAKRMETMRQILEGKGTEEGKKAHVHLLRARCGTVGIGKHGVGTKTLRSPGSRAARDVEGLVGRDISPNVERNQTEESKNCLPLLGFIAGC